MRCRHCFLMVASLLLVGSLAGAAEAATPAESLAASEAAVFASPAPADCLDAELLASGPVQNEPGAIACGACSDTICQGKQVGQFCKFQGGQFYYCRMAFVVCQPRDCQCWTGPLP